MGGKKYTPRKFFNSFAVIGPTPMKISGIMQEPIIHKVGKFGRNCLLDGAASAIFVNQPPVLQHLQMKTIGFAVNTDKTFFLFIYICSPEKG